MRIAITGSSGFVGSVLIKKLQESNHHLKLLSRQHQNHTVDNITYVYGDLLNKESLDLLVKDTEAVIHLAAIISAKDGNDENVFNTNINGTKNLLEAARNAGVKRFVHLSSVTAFNQKPFDETMDETRELTKTILKNYDLSKRISQEIALKYSDKIFEVIVLAPTAIFGPYDYKPSLIGNTIINFYNKKIPAIFNGGVDFVDIRDLANAIINTLTKGVAGKVYLISGEWISLKQLAAEIGQIKGKNISLPVLPVPLIFLSLPFIKIWTALTGKLDYFTKQAIYNLIFSNKKISCAAAEKELNYHKRPFKESLYDTIVWFKKNNFIK